jgi:hypothetical protein
MKIISRPGMLSKNISTNGDNWNGKLINNELLYY